MKSIKHRTDEIFAALITGFLIASVILAVVVVTDLTSDDNNQNVSSGPVATAPAASSDTDSSASGGAFPQPSDASATASAPTDTGAAAPTASSASSPSPAASPAPAATPARAAAAPRTGAAAAPKPAASAAPAGAAPAPKPGAAPAPAPAPAPGQPAPAPGQPAPAAGAAPVGPSPLPVPAGEERQGVSPTEILVGTTTAATGVMEFPGASDFSAAYLKMVNDQGGVNGRKFRYVVYDQDATDSNRALANVRRLNEENKVFAFVGGAHPFSDNIYPYLEEHGVPFFGSMAEIAQQYKRKNTFPAGLYRSMECRFPGEYLVKERKWKNTAIFKFNVYIADDCAQGVKASLLKNGGKVVFENVSAIGQPDYTAEVTQARQNNADSIFCATDGGTCVRIMQAAQRQGWKPTGGFASCSPCYSATIAKNMAQYADGAYVAAFVSHLWTSSNPGARLMVDTVKKYVPNARFDGAGLPVWAGTNFFIDAMRAIGNDISRSRLMGWAASQKSWAPFGELMPALDWTRLSQAPWYRVPSLHGLLGVLKDGDMQELTGFIPDPARGDPRPETKDW